MCMRACVHVCGTRTLKGEWALKLVFVLCIGLCVCVCVWVGGLGLFFFRVLGRRTDPKTGKIYHLKFNPPPDDKAVRVFMSG